MMFNKRGNLQDVFFSVVWIFFFIVFLGLMSIIAYHLMDAVNDLPDDIMVDDDSLTQITRISKIFRFVDKLVPLLFVLLWAISIFLSLRVIPDHPAFYFFSFVFLLVFTLVSIIFVDFSSLFFSNSVFDPIRNDLSNSLFFANNLHYISFFVMLISLIIFYSRNKAVGGDVGING